MRLSPSSILLWLIAALLLLLAWLTVTGRLGDSRHGYGLRGGAGAARNAG